MLNAAPPFRRRLLLLVLAAGFAVAHTQSPLFFSNQNQYLLHGLADAGYGHLSRDWLANTKDPTPLFSAAVAVGDQVGGLGSIQVAYFVLLTGYLLAAWRLAAAVSGLAPTVPHVLGFAAAFTAAHAAVLRLGSVALTGVDYPWYLQAGVAGQYALGPGLQPSSFGVLLVAAVAAFANGRPYLAAGIGAAAAVFHATYLLPAALLTAGFMAQLLAERRRRTAVGVGALSLAVVAPAVAYTLATFPPSSPGAFAEAQRILAEVRIPHHAVVGRWLDAVAVLQLAWVALGIATMWRSRLFLPLSVAALGATLLTLAQVATGDHTLALLFPWRISAVLVPVVTAVLTAKLVARLPATRPVAWGFGLAFVAAVIGGVVVMACGLGYQMNAAERPVLEFVAEQAGPNDVYLIPTRIPPVGTGRGSVSTSFTPPPRPKPGSNLIPVDLQRFRLATGAPIFVDFKSVPYSDVEVLEWYRRVRQAEAWYEQKKWDRATQDQLREAGITHVLVPRHQAIEASFLEPVYSDAAYTVFRVR